MKLGVFGRTSDPLSAHTMKVAQARGHDVALFAFADAKAVCFDGSSWLVDGDDVEACDAFVVRRYPALYAQLGPADETTTGAEHWKRTMKQVERSTFAQSCILDMHARGKPLANPLSPYDHKPLQLAAFERAGIRIPRTVVTNWPEAVRIFAKDVGDMIAKPAAGGAETIVVDEATDLSVIASSPVIFQERVRGPDIRVTIVGGRVLSSVAIEGGGDVDYRAGAEYQSGNAVYVDHPLPDDVRDMALEAAAVSGHVLSGVDLKKRGDDYFVLEANSAPVYLDIEQKTGAAITAAVVDHLAGRLAS